MTELNKAKEVVFHETAYAAASNDLRSQCNAILAACAPLPNSVVVMVVEEIVDAVQGLVDIGSELIPSTDVIQHPIVNSWEARNPKRSTVANSWAGGRTVRRDLPARFAFSGDICAARHRSAKAAHSG